MSSISSKEAIYNGIEGWILRFSFATMMPNSTVSSLNDKYYFILVALLTSEYTNSIYQNTKKSLLLDTPDVLVLLQQPGRYHQVQVNVLF